MGLAQSVQTAIRTAVRALGDLINPVLVATSIPTTPVPGEDFIQDYTITRAKGAFEAVKAEDFPGTTIEIGDRTLILLESQVEVKPHDWVLVEDEDTTYHVHKVKPEFVGTTRVLQKLLVRAEPKEIPWDSVEAVAS